MDESLKMSRCRSCSDINLTSVLHLGEVAYSGKFPSPGTEVKSGILELESCDSCGMAQLSKSFDSSEMFDEDYGYESHLNASMAKHLQDKARKIENQFLSNVKSPVIVDIASNDGTLLSGYLQNSAKFVGIDPLLNNLKDLYPKNSIKIPSFFSSESYFGQVESLADVVTSCSVLYDLDNPRDFIKQVSDILKDGGVWHSEQSYLPSMVKNLSYDTICHEHVLYLRLLDILNLIKESELQVIDVELNSTNGGSFAFTAVKGGKSKRYAQSNSISKLLKSEELEGFTDGTSLLNFKRLVNKHQLELRRAISEFKEKGFDIYGLGASTKGNILLQSSGLDSSLISAIGEVNQRKFGRLTPKTKIPIISEEEVLKFASPQTIFLVLPWHFKESILEKLVKLKKNNPINLLFPLPSIHLETI
jgi:hypothetical protein